MSLSRRFVGIGMVCTGLLATPAARGATTPVEAPATAPKPTTGTTPKPTTGTTLKPTTGTAPKPTTGTTLKPRPGPKPPSVPISSVAAKVETDAVAGEKDAADDMAIWVNPWDRTQSLV